MTKRVRAVGAVLVWVAASVPAHAADGARLALVIGNAGYTALPPLPACTGSAQVVTAALRRAGYAVTEKQDVSNGQMGAAIADFAAAVAKAPGASAVAYACGYVAGFDGRAFLLPVSANIERETDALTQGLVVTALTGPLARSGARVSLVLLDGVPKPGGGQPWLDAIAKAPPAPSQGIAAAESDHIASGGTTPFAAAIAGAIASPSIEVGALLTALRERLAGGGTRLAVRTPAGPLWLAGGPPPPVVPTAVLPSQAAPPPAPPPVLLPDEEHMTEADRRRVQEALLRLGYYAGRVDGVFGPDTRAAIRRLQHEIGAEMTGRITPEQATRLLTGSG